MLSGTAYSPEATGVGAWNVPCKLVSVPGLARLRGVGFCAAESRTAQRDAVIGQHANRDGCGPRRAEGSGHRGKGPPAV